MRYSHLEYSIEPLGDFWQVSFCHASHGTFRRRAEALRSAFADAERVTRLGQEVTVRIQRPRHAAGLPARILIPRVRRPRVRPAAS
ncbi:hypothetical protein VQ042_07875 [Aurantimonas sp. A2-1-M11]|uniref:hypothetical protein n=1 Tax=Aurantimonas sp. A2-1-M11 TaxID=3113712 RepID=UPI002F927DA6